MSMTDQSMSAVPAKGAADEAAMKDWAELLVARARALRGSSSPAMAGC